MSTSSDSLFVKDSKVYLGFGEVLEPHLSYRLLSHYMPLGKVGGKPAWLNPVELPSAESLTCRVCEKPMAFLAQVYASRPSDEIYSFHRMLFFFICNNSTCSKNNDASNIRSFRCMLPRYNNFYGDQAIDPDLDGEIPDPLKKSSYPNLCEICGCAATKKCGRCESAWYCCREHQTIDWSCEHKKKCRNQNAQIADDVQQITDAVKNLNNGDCWAQPKRSIAANPFVFPEYAIELDVEYTVNGSCEQDSDDDSDDDNNDDDDDNNSESCMQEDKRMEDYRQYIKKHSHHQVGDVLSGTDLEDVDDTVKKDVAFNRFSRTVALNAEQILRYARGGEPLLATDYAPLPEGIIPCQLCGSHREFELQLMPNLLSLIGVDQLGASIDWATVLLYTCAQNCKIPDDGYAEEFVLKQDFV